MNALIYATIAGFAFAAGFLIRGMIRRRKVADADVSAVIHRLRGVNRLLLANLSLPYTAQELVNQLADGRRVIGGTLRSADQASGKLTVLAVTEGLQTKGKHPGLFRLKRSAVTPEELQANDSSLVQALNQRQVVTGDSLDRFESPTIESAEAAEIQERLGISAIAAYPIGADKPVGVLTFYLACPLEELAKEELEVLQGIVDGAAVALENARLLAEVDSINQKLSTTNSELRVANETKEEFVSVASHQLRSPLTAVKGYLSMLTEGDFGIVPERQQSVIQQIVESTNEVINILNDMLSVSRINAQRFEITLSPTKLEEVVEDVVREFQPLARKKNLKLSAEFPKPPLEVLNLDAMRVRQVIVNFVDNAIKYTKRGSVTVKVARVADEAVVTVTDTGIGIKPEDRKRMWMKFFRAGNARGMVSSGTGLGLYVAKRIVDEHHGKPILESTLGKGTTFGFRLPLSMVKVSAQADARSRPRETREARTK